MKILSIECEDRRGKAQYDVVLHWELGNPIGHDRRSLFKKIGELFQVSSQFDVLFSDWSAGDIELFTKQFLDPRSVWLEVMRGEEGVGIMYLTDVNPYWDAVAHLSFWDKIFSGREPLIWATLDWAFERYKFHRMSAEIPVNLKLYNRFVREKLGFKQEGVRLEATIKDGEWIDMNMYGMLGENLKKLRGSWETSQEVA